MTTEAAPRPYVSRDGMMLGARLTVPFVPGLVIYGSAFGTAAAQKGMTLSETMLSSAIVFAGAAQLVSLELWRESWTFASVVAITLLVMTVNARMLLMGASLQPWLHGVDGRILWPGIHLMTDANWIIAERYRSGGGHDAGVLFGSGVLQWILWVLAAIPGYMAGSLVEEPRRWGLDLVMPIIFAGMLVPIWKGKQDLVPWGVAGAVALTTSALVPGYAFIVAGALSGALTAALLPVREHG